VCFGTTNGIASPVNKCTSRQSSAQRGNQPPRACAHRRQILKFQKIANLGFLCWGMIRALVGVIRCIARLHGVLWDDKRHRQPSRQVHKPPIQRAAWQSAAESVRTQAKFFENSKNRESRVSVAEVGTGPRGRHLVHCEDTRCVSGRQTASPTLRAQATNPARSVAISTHRFPCRLEPRREKRERADTGDKF
jgi:hypothetical protein